MENLKTPKGLFKINWPLALEYSTTAAFDNFSPKKYFRQISILGNNEWKKNLNRSLFCYVNFKSWLLGGIFFLISYQLASKIEICQEYFLLQRLRFFEGFWPSWLWSITEVTVEAVRRKSLRYVQNTLGTRKPTFFTKKLVKLHRLSTGHFHRKLVKSSSLKIWNFQKLHKTKVEFCF